MNGAQAQKSLADDANLQEAVNQSHSHVHGLLQQAELEVNLHQPVDENGAHVAGHLLSLQEVWPDVLLSLKREKSFQQVESRES